MVCLPERIVFEMGVLVFEMGGAVSEIGGVVSEIGGVVSEIGGVVSEIGGVVSEIGGVASEMGGVVGFALERLRAPKADRLPQNDQARRSASSRMPWNARATDVLRQTSVFGRGALRWHPWPREQDSTTVPVTPTATDPLQARRHPGRNSAR